MLLTTCPSLKLISKVVNVFKFGLAASVKMYSFVTGTNIQSTAVIPVAGLW